MPAQRLGQALGNRQAQTGASRFGITAPGSCLVATVEALEEEGAFGRGDSRSGIRDRESNLAVPACRAQRDTAAVRGELDRVVQQVEENLVQAIGVGQNGERV